ncbi:hypothetical protein MKW98_025287 [Papaver atlanticum]|uniref:Uncharacterized protein n=1 Tax=Papaver atlanticum TaxID=357466 RepID=A0AAD4S1V8_9MAGN|nr:hypothetical protein MKW98_025287 [Papaver atlanticum]
MAKGDMMGDYRLMLRREQLQGHGGCTEINPPPPSVLLQFFTLIDLIQFFSEFIFFIQIFPRMDSQGKVLGFDQRRSPRIIDRQSHHPRRSPRIIERKSQQQRDVYLQGCHAAYAR